MSKRPWFLTWESHVEDFSGRKIGPDCCAGGCAWTFYFHGIRLLASRGLADLAVRLVAQGAEGAAINIFKKILDREACLDYRDFLSVCGVLEGSFSWPPNI